jgi:hypothetical protein
MMNMATNFTVKVDLIKSRLDRIQESQREHFRLFRKLKRLNTVFKAVINVLNTISVTSLVLTFSGSDTTLLVCAVSNSLSAVGSAVLSVVAVEDKVHSHQTSYLQFVELYDTYFVELLKDDLNGRDLDVILTDLNAKIGLILDNCEPINIGVPHSMDHNSECVNSRRGGSCTLDSDALMRTHASTLEGIRTEN